MNDIEKTEQEKAPKKAEKSRVDFWATALSVAAFPISAVSAYFPLKIFGRRAIYKNYAQTGYFDDLQEQFGIKHADIKNEVLSPLKRGEDVVAHNVPQRTNQLRGDYREAVKERFKKLGVTNIKHYWEGMHPNQKFEVVFSALTAAGISLGAILTVANNLDKLKGLFDKDRSDDSSPSR